MKHKLMAVAIAALAVCGMWAASAQEGGGKAKTTREGQVKKGDAEKKTKPPFVHAVIFYLKKDAPKFPVTDYEVGLLVLFDNYEGLQEYLDRKLHTEYVGSTPSTSPVCRFTTS